MSDSAEEPELIELDQRHAQEREQAAAKRVELIAPLDGQRNHRDAEQRAAEKLLAAIDVYHPPSVLPHESILAPTGKRIDALLADVRKALKERVAAQQFALNAHESALVAHDRLESAREIERAQEREALVEKIRLEDERLLRAMARKGLSVKGNKK